MSWGRSKVHFYVTSVFQELSNVAITCHWVDNVFVLQEALLDFVRIIGRHRGVDLAPYLLSTLDRYGIMEKLFCITTDNASNNDTLCKELSILMEATHGIHWDHKSHNVRCLNHVINIAVQSFMQGIKSLMEEDEDEESGDDDYDGEDSEGEEIRGDGFARALFKLHTISKV